jgi:putative colanic acid biosynthesis glycosyltransferase
MEPDVSIITTTLNCRSVVRATIESVASQKGVITQHIIIDAASSDGTQQEILGAIADSTVFLSEPDSGIFDAMNKGIERSLGRYLYFLGAGDCLVTELSLYSLIKASEEGVDLVFGDVIYDTGAAKTSYFNWRLLFYNSFHHQSCIYSRRVFDNFRYDPDLKICADYELNLMLWLKRAKFRQTDTLVAMAPFGGVSTQAASFERIMSDDEKVRLRLLPSPIGRLISFVEGTRRKSKRFSRRIFESATRSSH